MSWEYKQYIAHHGILGQKWGVRRYQNPDGTLTAEGRARLGKKYEDDSLNRAFDAALFKYYSDPKMADTKEIAEHNAKQAVKAESYSKYLSDMSKMLLDNSRDVKLSDLEESASKFAKKYNLDVEELLTVEREFWDNFR